MTRSNDRLKSEVAQVLDDVRQLITGFADAQRRHRAVTASVSVERDRITVTADASGAVAEVSYAEDIDDLGYHQIARGTVLAAQQAATEVKRRAEEILAPLRLMQARLPKLTDLVGELPRQDEIPPPPPALLTPLGDRKDDDFGAGPLDAPPGGPGASGSALDDQDVGARIAQLVRLQDRRARVFATGTAEGRRVLAAVNADGILIDLKFSSGIADLDYDEIAEAVTEASRAAVAEVARMVTELFAPVSGDHPPYPGPAIALAGIEQLRNQLL